MNATRTSTVTPASLLQKGDVVDYYRTTITVVSVSPLQVGRLVEVHGTDEDGQDRFIDYGAAEAVTVVEGPTLEATKAAEAPKPAESAITVALRHVSNGRLRNLPVAATAVLYAIAAVEDTQPYPLAPSLSQVAAAATLATSTTSGHLRSLASLGVVGGSNDSGWRVARR